MCCILSKLYTKELDEILLKKTKNPVFYKVISSFTSRVFPVFCKGKKTNLIF